MDDHGVERLGEHLKDKNIALLVTGGIAAYKSPSLVRHLRQYGADVHVYMTQSAKEFVTETSLEWASANPVITRLGSSSEHLRKFDAYIVAPATYNVIGKAANGIADDTVTTTLAAALGGLYKRSSSLLIAPTMHGSMENLIYKNNLHQLKQRGARIIEPDYKWGKANLPSAHRIVVETVRETCRGYLKDAKILVTAGPTPGRIDNVRLLHAYDGTISGQMTNRFRGRLGVMIAEEAYMRGADVKLILGASGIDPPEYLDTLVIHDYDEYHEAVMGEIKKRYDVGIFSAAVADYIPTNTEEGKIPSRGALESIPVRETAKVIQEVRKECPEMLMATFKYEEGVTKERLIEIAKGRIGRPYRYDLVVANRGEDMKEQHNSIIVDETGVIAEPSSKLETARSLLDCLDKKRVYHMMMDRECM